MTERIIFNKIKKEWENNLTPTLYNESLAWYPLAHDFCKDLAKQHKLAVSQTAGICASLSPLKSWSLNKELTKEFLQGKERGHFRKQIEKARKIKRISIPSTIDIILNGNKTVNFFRNIYDPSDDKYTTIDSHILRFIGDGELLNSTNYRYNITKNAIIRFGKYVDLPPNVIQAFIWLRAKELWGNDV